MMLHGTIQLPEQDNNPPLPSLMVTPMIENTASSIEEPANEDNVNGDSVLIKHPIHTSYIIIMPVDPTININSIVVGLPHQHHGQHQ
jgi:hypothetical protein